MPTLQSTADKTAIGLSLACAIHCLALPVALTLIPTLSTLPLGDEKFHQLLLLAVLPISLVALVIGCRKHYNYPVIALGISGLSVMIFAATLGHDLLGEAGEKIMTLVGAAILAYSHIQNHKLCREKNCDCE